MKGRFSRIFELFNKRNSEYYQKAFRRLDKENKTTFNFAAAFGSSAWLVFRKMYGWAALFTLIYVGGCEILFAFCKDNVSKIIIWLILLFFSIMLLGFFGNNLYYREVKSKIAKGYVEMEKYNSIDPIGGIVLVGIVYLLCSSFLGHLLENGIISENISNLLTILIGVFFIAIPWAINYKKFHSQESAEPVEVTEESVNRYLEKADPKHLTLPMLGALFIMAPLSIVYILICLISVVIGVETSYNQVAQQSDKVAEEIIKTPNNSEISKEDNDNLLNN